MEKIQVVIKDDLRLPVMIEVNVAALMLSTVKGICLIAENSAFRNGHGI